jgi:hypothetical protein
LTCTPACDGKETEIASNEEAAKSFRL